MRLKLRQSSPYSWVSVVLLVGAMYQVKVEATVVIAERERFSDRVVDIHTQPTSNESR